MDALLALARPDIQKLVPYVSAGHENRSGNIYLNANENPFTLNSSAADAAFNRYPAPQPPELVSVLRNLYSVDDTALLITRGSDEAIDLLLRVFCRAGIDAILTCSPTYGMYPVSAGIQGARIVDVPLRQADGFSIDTQAILERWDETIKLIFLCSPNNPTGNVLSRDAILHLCGALSDKALVVVDEAYIEFADTPSLTQDLKNNPNLVVLRTLSKAYGLAGARCGAVLAHPAIIALLAKVIPPYPLSTPTVLAIRDHLTPDYLTNATAQVKVLNQEREQLRAFLNNLPFVKQVYPSDANFILVEVNDAAALMQHCEDEGVILRDRSQMPGLENCVRISIGTPEENAYLKEVLTRV